MRLELPRTRRGRTLSVIGVSALLALACSVLSVARIGVFPPSIEPRGTQVAGATMRVLVDPPDSWVADRRATPLDYESLTKRADLFGRMMTTVAVRERIARRMGVSADDLAGIAWVTANVPATLKEPDAERRANDIAVSRRRYRLDIQSNSRLPILDLYAQAPSPEEAERLAAAAVAGLRDELRAIAASEGADFDESLMLRTLREPRAQVVNAGAGIQIAGLTFLVVFALSGCLLGLAVRARHGRDRRSAEPEAPPAAEPARGSGRGRVLVHPAVAAGGEAVLPRTLPSLDVAGALRIDRLRERATHGGDWPNTTRVLPWMLAAFIAILWLTPFNTISLSASLPFDLKLDRLVLPFIVLAWGWSLLRGGPGAPRLRLTWIHIAVGAFVALACLSIVLDAGYLNMTLELDQSIKKLTLVISYLTVFLIIASVVRPGEVRPFLAYFLGLGVICALGIIWEYRTQYNVFYDLSDKLLPGIFQVGRIDPSAVDAIGRREARGSAELGLEAVSMLTMALPIALAGLMHGQRPRTRVLYALAGMILLAGAMSTYRKSAFLAPITVLLTFACFRPRHLLKLAPLAAVTVVTIQLLSPGALSSIAFQLNRNQLGVATVSDRTADYDAVRPDLWTHLAFGRGYGSYEQLDYRILDSEILHRTVEMGVLGLVAYVLIFLTVIAVARPGIRAQHRLLTPPSLVGAAAAVGFLTVSTLYDVMSFPHTPYLFLCLAAFAAIVAHHSKETK